jgi:putative endonuclease
MRRGWRVVARNYFYVGGEIDIVAQDRAGTWLFVEVKSVWHTGKGAPDNRLDAAKKRRVAHAAAHFLHFHGGLDQAARFDVAAVDGRFGKSPVVRYYEGAFEAPFVIADL